jgi:hypothetical protein
VKRILTAVAVTLALAIATPGPTAGLGTESVTIETVYAESVSGGLTSSVEFTFDEPTVLVDALIAQLASELDGYTLLMAFDSEGREVYRDDRSSVR